MQTIDIGNITIGGDAPQCPAAPEMPHLEEETHTACEEAHTPHEPQPCGQGNSACESAATILPSNIAGGICFNSCETYKSAEIGCVPPDGQGRILDLSFTIRSVCPNCRIAVCVALYEVDSCGCEKPCGIKMFTVGPTSCSRCADIPVSGLRFILPENIGGEGASCCRRRCINVKLMTNYIDFGESARHF